MNIVERAKIIKKELRATYPNFKFSVKTDRKTILVEILQGDVECCFWKDFYADKNKTRAQRDLEIMLFKETDSYKRAKVIYNKVEMIMSKGQKVDTDHYDYMNTNFYTEIDMNDYKYTGGEK